MRRIDYLTRDARTMADFLDLMQSDGLQAKGCSLYLMFPGETTWEEWLETDNPNEDAWDIAAMIEEMRRTVDNAAAERGDS